MKEQTALIWWAIGGWVFALLLLWAWWSGVRFYRLLKDMPTVRIRGIFVGLVETTGTAKCARPLAAGISDTACVFHRWSVSEHWRRTETYRDKDGKTRTRVVSGSDVVASGGAATDFDLTDDTDAIAVRVKHADWRSRTSVSEQVARGHPLYHTKAPGTVVSGSTGVRSFSEDIVAVGDPLYVVGSAAISSEGTTLELRRDGDDEDMLIISTGTEKSVAGGRLAWAIVAFVFGVALAGAGTAPVALLLRDAPLSDAARSSTLWTGAAVGAAAFMAMCTGMWLFIMRNGVVRVRTRWQRAVSLVDVQLRRRFDLIPNLVAVTQGLATHERTVQVAMAELRAGTAADVALRALVEAYPQLKADGAFLKLQAELAATEDRIALARRFELESRAAFLDRLRTFPEGLVARAFGVAAPPPELGQADAPDPRVSK
ncbi:MAG: LemA family protein [Phycisphaerae bacterium]|nr:LemA family protein [Phycisphaerae bacterium]